MYKYKRRKPNLNHVLQWVIIALIIGIVVSHFNLWAFWWIPFLFFMFRGCSRSWRHSCSSHDKKRKYDDEADDVHYV
jgi:hypothetical protein